LGKSKEGKETPQKPCVNPLKRREPNPPKNIPTLRRPGISNSPKLSYHPRIGPKSFSQGKNFPERKGTLPITPRIFKERNPNKLVKN